MEFSGRKRGFLPLLTCMTMENFSLLNSKYDVPNSQFFRFSQLRSYISQQTLEEPKSSVIEKALRQPEKSAQAFPDDTLSAKKK